MSLTPEQRKALPESDFAVPGKRLLPIHDARHVRMAHSQLSRAAGLTHDEVKHAKASIRNKAVDFGVDVSSWDLHAVSYSLAAMAIDVPMAYHPNKMPFSGILTRIDEPSDNPPNGSNGKRTFIPRHVAEAALPSLMAMAVDFVPKFDGHDRKNKIGLITEAKIEGTGIKISGFLYAADFPSECAKIKSEKDKLGFSFECQAHFEDEDADPLVVVACTFTGAAILYKDIAAYTTTSLAATAEVNEMSQEILDAIKALSAEVAEIKSKSLEASAMHMKVKPHADAMRACADGLEAAGMGMHPTHGHVKIMRHMAACMEAESMMGTMPHIYRDHDYGPGMAAAAEKPKDTTPSDESKNMAAAITDLSNQIKSLQAAAADKSPAPERKTLTPEISALIAKHNLSAASETGKLTVAEVDKALSGLTPAERMTQKIKLSTAGVMAN